MEIDLGQLNEINLDTNSNFDTPQVDLDFNFDNEISLSEFKNILYDALIRLNKKSLIIWMFLHCQYYLVDRLSINWLIELRAILQKELDWKKFKIYVDVKKDYGLFISLVENKFEYIAVKGNVDTLIRLGEIAKKNKVLINPNFSILDLSKTKNIFKKITKIIL